MKKRPEIEEYFLTTSIYDTCYPRLLADIQRKYPLETVNFLDSHIKDLIQVREEALRRPLMASPWSLCKFLGHGKRINSAWIAAGRPVLAHYGGDIRHECEMFLTGVADNHHGQITVGLERTYRNNIKTKARISAAVKQIVAGGMDKKESKKAHEKLAADIGKLLKYAADIASLETFDRSITTRLVAILSRIG